MKQSQTQRMPTPNGKTRTDGFSINHQPPPNVKKQGNDKDDAFRAGVSYIFSILILSNKQLIEATDINCIADLKLPDSLQCTFVSQERIPRANAQILQYS